MFADGIESRIYDRVSSGYIQPALDGEENLEATFRFFDDDIVRFTITRALDTTEEYFDYLVPVEQEFDLGWAINTDTIDLNKKHSHAGALKVIIPSDGSYALGEEGVTPDASYSLILSGSSLFISLITMLSF